MLRLAALSAFSRPLLFGRPDSHPNQQRDQHDKALLALDGARSELARLEATLAASPFLATPTLSAANILRVPADQAVRARAREAGRGHPQRRRLGPLPAVFPQLAAWCGAIEALPGYEATYPPHWREG